MLFSFFIGILEKWCASELEKYLERYHKDKLAEDIANAPVTNKEESDYWLGK